MEPARIERELRELGAQLAKRRDVVLMRWRELTSADPALTTGSSLTRAQFYDHIPEVLDAFERRLSAHRVSDRVEAEVEQRESAAGHGLQRWQQGYQQREAMREWRHLHLCLVDELEGRLVENPSFEPMTLVFARRALAELCSDGVCESAEQYERLQQAEAAGRVRELEAALEQLSALEQERAAAWREAAHDLRGRVGAVTNAAELLREVADRQVLPAQALRLLERSTGSLHGMLEDLLSLARLEAGQEQRILTRFDAGAVLRELGEGFRPVAIQRGLFLSCEGPTEFLVEGDTLKIQRVAQNLLLNALRYTTRGGVKLTWEDLHGKGPERWSFSVQDTGPGLDADATPALTNVLRQATEESQAVAERAEDAPADRAQPAPTLPSRSSDSSRGEGIGLSIVKRLCEFLDATLELETHPGRGSTFRVTLPRSYDA